MNTNKGQFKKGKEHRRYKHGLTGTPIYKRWELMKRRCDYKNQKNYCNYGGRGIKVCKRWLDFMNFYNVILYEYDGEKLSVTDWARRLGIKRLTLRTRIKSPNWTLKEALTTKVDLGNKYKRKLIPKP